MDESTPLVHTNNNNNNYTTTTNDEEHTPLPEDDHHNNDEWNGHHRRESLLETVVERAHEFQEVVAERAHELQEVVVETAAEIKEVVVDTAVEIKEVLEENVADPVAPRDPGEHSRKLNALQLAILVFYKVSGGPFGCEVSVKSAGAYYTLIGFVLFPLLWCLPEALVTAELGSAYPEPSGPIAWVEEAFGSEASLLCGYFHYVSGATDNAIYPSLFLKYLTARYMSNLTRFLICSAITIVLAIVNFLGLEIVGNLSIAVCVISMSPFVILCGAALPKMHISRWSRRPVGPVQWRAFLNNIFWNLNSFDAGANFAGEVQDPATVFPRAMFMSIFLVSMGYLLPLGASLGAVDTKQSDWDAGFLTDVSISVAGPWLGVWLILAAAISNIGLFEAELSGDSFQLLGMADRGLIPKLFSKRSRYQTPTNGILVGTIIIIAMSLADFEQLVEMLNFAYSLSFLMEFAAFIQLRISQPDVERPYKIPLNTVGCALFVTPPCIFLVWLMLSASQLTYIYLIAVTAFGLLFHLFQKTVKHYHLVEYTEAPRRKKGARAGNV